MLRLLFRFAQIAILALGFSAQASSDDYCFTGDNKNIARYIDYLRDPDRIYDAARAAESASAFIRSTSDSIDFGSTNDRFWFRFDINNCTKARQDLLFNMNIVRVGLMKIYELTDTGPELIFDSKQPGAVKDKVKQFAFIAFRFSLQPDQNRSYMIRLEAANNSALPFEVTNELDHIRGRVERERIISAILAALLAMVTLNALLFLFTQMRVFGLYVVIEFIACFYIFHTCGWSTVWLWGDGPFDVTATGLLAASITTMIPIFTREYYRENLQKTPLTDKALLILALGGISYLILKVANFFIDVFPSTSINNYGYIFGNLGLWVSLYVAVRYAFFSRAERLIDGISNYLILAAWVLITGNVIVMALRSMNVMKMDNNAILEFGYVILLEAILLTIALSLRIRTAYADREQSMIAQVQSQQSAKEAGRLILAVGHDSRQMLSALDGYCDMLAKDTSAARAPLIDQIRRVSHTLSDVLTNALDAGERESFEQALPTIYRFKADRIFEPLELIYKQYAREQNCQIRFKAHEGTISSDRVLIMRILGNLISNSIRFAPDGRVLVTVRKRSDHMLYQVRDTGPGIPKDIIKRIQRGAMQLPDRTDKAAMGKANLGIGLRGAFDMATALRAKLEIKSVDGVGTCISLQIRDQI